MRIAENFQNAFQSLSQYESYKLRKAWGQLFIAVGVIWVIAELYLPIWDGYTNLRRTFPFLPPIEQLMPLWYFITFGIIGISVYITVQTYLSYRKTVIEDGVLTFRSDLLYGLSILLMWGLNNAFSQPLLYFNLFNAQFYYWEYNTHFLIITQFWGGILANLAVYLILKFALKMKGFNELIVALVTFLIVSIPFILDLIFSNILPFLVTDQNSEQIITVLSLLYSFIYVFTGAYSIWRGNRILSNKQE